jgi:hypothetical protein
MLSPNLSEGRHVGELSTGIELPLMIPGLKKPFD